MIDILKLRNIYKFGKNLTLADVKVLIDAASRRSYKPGEFLIKEGSLRKEVFLIRKGLIRAYKLNKKGIEITTSIRWENKIAASVLPMPMLHSAM